MCVIINSELMYFVIIILIIFVALIHFLTHQNRMKSSDGDFKNFHAYSSSNETIKVMSWNLSYFYGPGSEGNNYKHEDIKHYEDNLAQAVMLIKKENPDILLLQEIDFNSHKSHYINQLNFLAQKLQMNYAKATSWKVKYLPYPGFFPKNHFKSIDSGSAVLSKFNIKSNYLNLFAKPKENNFITNLFYPYRYFQEIKLDINGKEVGILNIHLEAFRKKTRNIQAKELVNYLKDKKDIICIGGDFNTIPTNASMRDGFYGLEFENYHDDKTYEIITSYFNDGLSLEVYKSNEESFYTFNSKNLRESLIIFLFQKM
jgi:endonuclease/exonuclease/phosphatase family metal-dependent hydrolase